MEHLPPPRRRTVPVLLIVLLLLASGALFFGYWNAWKQDRRLRRSVEGVTRLRIWAAGIRTNPDGSFCPCAPVPKPERMLYETTSPGEIQGLLSAIRARPTWGGGMTMTESCSTITLDFHRGEDLALSLHPKGAILRACFTEWWEMPLSDGSRGEIEKWLGERSIREKIQAARR